MTKKRKQHYMTYEERLQLEALLKAKIPIVRIAKQLGFCRSTIYNEIKRGTYMHTCRWWDEERYSANKAQQLHDYNQTAKGRPLKIGHDRDYAAFLENKMLGRQNNGKIDRRKRYSPAAALAAARAAGYKNSVCVTTLYSYIDKGIFLHLTQRDLWEKSKRKKQSYEPVQRIAHPRLPSIADRPEAINNRQSSGDWEMDLVISAKGSTVCLLTLVNRQSRETIIIRLPNRKASTIRAAFDELERSIPNFREKFQSITTDNGSEFLQYEDLIRSIQGGKRFDIYYCHSYAAWEKGTNENHNRMIRRWFPKGTDFSKITKAEIAELQDWMNNYPRKVLNWKTPADLTT